MEEKCELTGLLSWVSQGVLFIVAILAVVYKRHVEKPKRLFLVWFFDCTKQALGTVIEHFASLILAVVLENPDYDGCVWFMTNYNFDLTLGLLFHYLFIKLIAFVVKKMKKEEKWWFLESGKYGAPPKTSVFLLQSFIYCLNVFVSKIILTVLLLLFQKPANIVSEWGLSFLKPNRHLEIIIVMGVYPIIMSTLSFVIQDSVIKSDGGSTSAGGAFARLANNAETGMSSVLPLTKKEGGEGKGGAWRKLEEEEEDDVVEKGKRKAGDNSLFEEGIV